MSTLDLNSTQNTEYSSSDAMIDEAYGSGVTSGGSTLLNAQDGWDKLSSDNKQIAKNGLKRFFAILIKLSGSSSISFSDDELMTTAGTSWTLSNSPNPSTSFQMFRNGIRDYNVTISGNVATLGVAKGTDHITANYRF